MSKPTKEELIESLWEAYVYPHSGNETDRIGRALAAFQNRRKLFQEAREAGRTEEALVAQGDGRAIIALLNNELANWLIDLPESPSFASADTWEKKERTALIALDALRGAAMPPTHSEAIDPVALLLPNWLHAKLIQALHALEDGEIQPILKPRKTGKHGPSFTIYRFRVRALQHVAFLKGRHGSLTKAAQYEVGVAIGVPARTLEDWDVELRKEYDDYDEVMGEAFAAGEFARKRTYDPTFARGDGNHVDSHVHDIFLQIEQEPLAEFGARYQAMIAKPARRSRKKRPFPPGDFTGK